MDRMLIDSAADLQSSCFEIHSTLNLPFLTSAALQGIGWNASRHQRSASLTSSRWPPGFVWASVNPPPRLKRKESQIRKEDTLPGSVCERAVHMSASLLQSLSLRLISCGLSARGLRVFPARAWIFFGKAIFLPSHVQIHGSLKRSPESLISIYKQNVYQSHTSIL